MDGFISILMNHFPFLLNISSTWFMVGLIWLIQIVHYPLFNLVGKNEFQVYHNGHSVLITPLVGTVMIIELISSILLVVFPPKNISITIPIIGVILVFIIWASTAFLQIPQHNLLSKAYELEQSAPAKDSIAQILSNSRMSALGKRPLCQDTGTL